MKKNIVYILFLVILLTLNGCENQKKFEIDRKNNNNTTCLNGKNEEKTPRVQLIGEKVIQYGPYGSISIIIPEGWNYKLCDVDDESLYLADYGIHIYPSNEEEGYIELGYHTSFGVCGTGLETKEKKLAGASAIMGYYDGNKLWSYITFSGKNEKIVAVANSVKDWDSNYIMREALNILDTLEFNAKEKSGAIGVYNEDSEIENICLRLSAKKISSTKAIVVFTQYNEEIVDELFFGKSFKIEKKEGNIWKEAPIVVKDNYGFEDIAIIINKNNTTKHEYNWEWLYGSLVSGTYRIAIDIYGKKDTGEYKKYTAYAHFIIR